MMVLIVIMVFAVMAGLFAYSMKVETKLARNASFDADFEWAARSGVEYVRWILANDSSGPRGMAQIDSKRNKWAGGPGDTNGPLAEVDLNQPIVLGNARIGPPQIVDCDSKFNINRVIATGNDEILKQALTLIGVDAAEVPTIAGSILDWGDPDHNPHMAGAENDFYKSQNPPYFCKDGPIDDLSELLLVKGVTPAIYWGSKSSGARRAILNRPVNARSALDEPVYAIGLVDLFTALSSGRVNINTASPEVLQLMPEIDSESVPRILNERNGPDGVEKTEDDGLPSPQALMAVVPALNQPLAAARLNQFFGVRSMVFQVTIPVNIGGQVRSCEAVLLRRNGQHVEVLSFWWK